MKTFLKILFVFLIWRSILFIVGGFADSVLVYDPSFPYVDGILKSFNTPKWFYSWAGFDGVHYLTIMMRGYHGADLIQAFFPVYPYLSKLINYIVGNFLISSLLVSNISFIFLLYIFYEFIKSEFNQKIAFWSTGSLLLFPTSLFFVASYTESLFLILVIGAFWFNKKKQYWLTALCILFASATKITGIVLLPAIIFDIVFNAKTFNSTFIKTSINKIKKFRKYLIPSAIVSLGSLGLFTYMYYLYIEFGDALHFFHVQEEFGGGVRQESLVTYPQVIWRYIKILVTARPINLKYYSYVQDMLASVIGLLTLIYASTKIKLSYVVFALFAFFVPTLTGTFSSMPRYILICFPIFILLGIWSEKSKLFRYTWFTLSTILLVVNTILFIQGYWIA